MFTTQRLKRVLDKVTMLQSRSLYGHCQMPARIASGLSTRILHIPIGLAGTVHSLHRWMCDRCLVWTNVGTYPLRIAMGRLGPTPQNRACWYGSDVDHIMSTKMDQERVFRRLNSSRLGYK